jgi:hypothetical protein
MSAANLDDLLGRDFILLERDNFMSRLRIERNAAVWLSGRPVS